MLGTIVWPRHMRTEFWLYQWELKGIKGLTGWKVKEPITVAATITATGVEARAAKTEP